MAELEHRHLRSALEFAVLMAAEGQKRKPAIPYPKELKPFFNRPRVPTGSLGRLRRVIEADDLFRSRIAAGALPELVDDVGRLWLTRPEGWEAQAAALAARHDAEAASGDHAAQLKRAERRREAAEQAAVRTRADLLRQNEIIAAQGMELHELRADVVKADEAMHEMRTELIDARVELRHARDREAAAVLRAEQARREVDDLRAALADRGDLVVGASTASTAEPVTTPDPVTDAAPVTAAEPAAAAEAVIAAEPVAAAADLATAAAAARDLADRLDAMLAGPAPSGSTGAVAPTTRRRSARRTPLALPGGVISTSRRAAEFLVRSDASVLVDGYNVAMLGWPNQPLEQQRRLLLDGVDNLVRRFGTDVTVVFDGADVVGAHADRRRLVRVVYSAQGVTADDVIRDEVRHLPHSRQVVVVTNDAEIVRDVRAQGANVVPSNALLAVL